MNAPIPAPEKRKRFEFRSSRCKLHGNRCAERRERHAEGEWVCVFCVNAQTAAAMLQQPAPPSPAVASIAPAPPKPDTTQAAHDSSQSADDASVDGGAGTYLPPGWRRCDECSADLECIVHETHNDTNIVCTQIGRSGDSFFWENMRSSGRAPSRAQAMCAALGIDVAQSDKDGWWSAGKGPVFLAQHSDSADECARAALEAFHAQQQPNGLAKLFGKWPGDETEDEILAALKNDHDGVWSALNLMAGEALELWGTKVRVTKLIEEMGELQSELAKTLIGHKRASDAKVINEIADVFITLESVALAFGFERVEASIPAKLDRLAAAIAEGKKPGLLDQHRNCACRKCCPEPRGAIELSAQELGAPAIDPVLRAFEADGIVQPSTASQPPDTAETVSSLMRAAQAALWAHGEGKTTAEQYGVELLRVSNELATVSKQIRGQR